MCGAIIPEGQQVCPRCVENVTSLRSTYIARSSQAALPEVPILRRVWLYLTKRM